ncbi:MAG: thiamine phosphate synthase [Clostridiales bacterium]|nr:thiamine phosphate synthase [Clostridiales bacterium]
MFDILCVTNRKLCNEDFLTRIEKVACAGPNAIILREKDLPENEYKSLAISVMEVCSRHNVRCILHTYAQVARELGAPVHMPMPLLRSLDKSGLRFGASCHSVDEAVEAERLGCSYITAGHIFETDCKKDLPGRGIEFLHSVCNAVSIPVYAIGGINASNVRRVAHSGAAGACVMSGAMSGDVTQFFNQLNNSLSGEIK